MICYWYFLLSCFLNLWQLFGIISCLSQCLCCRSVFVNEYVYYRCSIDTMYVCYSLFDIVFVYYCSPVATHCLYIHSLFWMVCRTESIIVQWIPQLKLFNCVTLRTNFNLDCLWFVELISRKFSEVSTAIKPYLSWTHFIDFRQ